MLPSSALGLAVLLCLVPGLLYVRLTERTRHPRESSPLLEGVEVLAMGLLSIAAVVGPITLLNPQGVREFVSDPFTDPRRFVAWVSLVVIGSAGAANVLARIRVARYPSRYSPTVWTKTFDEFRPGYVREVLVELIDRRQFQGTLLACTLDPSVEQQISISAPIKRVDGVGAELKQERMTFPSSQIATISMIYTAAGFEVVGPDDRTRRSRAKDSLRVGWWALRDEWFRSSRGSAAVSATDLLTDELTPQQPDQR